MEKNKRYIKKGEKGAITLFVLLACLFFVFILTGVYVSNLNKLQVQEQEIKQIQENYARDIERVDEIYENMTTNKESEVTVELTQTPINPTEDGWTKEGVILDANAEIESEDGEETTKEFVKYIITNIAEPTTIPEEDWITVIDEEKQKIEYTTPEDEPITTNDTYYFHVEVKDIETGETEIKTESIEIGNIDNTPPIAGKLKDENEYYTPGETIVLSKDAYIEKEDGSDHEPGSGHKETTYTIEKDGEIYEITDENGNKILAEGIKEPESTTLTEDGTYEITVKTEDIAGNTAENNYIIVIDRTAPTAGILVDKNEEEFNKEEPTYTKEDTYIKKKEGTDNSGTAETTYTIKKDGMICKITDENGQDIIMYEVEEPSSTILTEDGTYEITVKTEDKAGNSVENNYTIIIDRIAPIAGTLVDKDNNEFSKEEPTYSDEDTYIKKIDGTDDLGEAETTYTIEKDGEIYEITDEDGNKKKAEDIINPESTTLTELGMYEITVKTEDNIGNTAENKYTIIIVEKIVPEVTLKHNDSNGTTYEQGTWTKDDIYGEVTIDTSIIKKTVEKYQYSYNKEEVFDISETQTDIVIDSYIKNGNTITFKLKEDIANEIYIRAVYNGETGSTSKYTDAISIKIDKTAPVINNSEKIILSKESAKIAVKVTEEGSGIKGYYISTSDTEPTKTSSWTSVEGNEFTTEELNTNTTYNLWVIDNVGNISEKQKITIEEVTQNYVVDGKIFTETLAAAITAASDGSTIKLLCDYTDTSTATFNKNVTFSVQSYTLTRSATITINSGKTVEITGTGKITTETSNVNTIYNNGTLTISDSITIYNKATSSSCAAIRNQAYGSSTNIKDSAYITGYYNGIYIYYGTVNVNGGIIESTYDSSTSCGIYLSYSGKIFINEGKIKGYSGIRNLNNSSLLEMTGGKVIGTKADGIYSIGPTNIFGGRIEGKTRGVYSNQTNKLTIGREKDELNTTNPAIYGGNYGIYCNSETYNFNFYNGVLISNSEKTTYRGVLNPRTDYIPYTYFDESELKYCTILVPGVENITMEATPTEYTNGDVTVKITYPYIKGIRQYSENGNDWVDVDGYIKEIIVTENKTIYARMLNESGILIDENQKEIKNIDKEKPAVSVRPGQTSYIVTETNGTVDLSLTITAVDTGVSGLEVMQYAWAKEGESPQYIDFSNTVTVNKTKLGIGQYNLYFNVTDKAGNKADVVQMRYTVKYAEPVAKIGNTKYLTVQDAVEACSKEAFRTEFVETDYSTTFPINDDKPECIGKIDNELFYCFEVQEDGTLKSNNSKIMYSTANSYIDIDLTNIAEEEEIEITLNTTISSLSGYDFGYATITESTDIPKYNSTDGRFIYVSGTETAVDHTTTLLGGKKYYLHIGYSKNGYTNVGNDTFIINSLNIKGILPKNVIEEPTTIEMLKSTDEEFETYKGQNIILDLKGYTIESSNLENALCTNNAQLQIIDSSTVKTGKIESLNKIAVLNKGTFILGNNSTSIEMEVPTIYGYQKGIDNKGAFNFYDGKIQGITPIQGNVTDTPDEYGPVTTDYSNGITTMQLGIVSDYEARIDWVYYTKLEEAVNATKQYKNGYKDTVTLVKNIQLNTTLQTFNSQGMILDLNGHELTVIPEINKVIENYGNLEVTDSSKEELGRIIINQSNTCYSIYNQDLGHVKVTGGTVQGSTYGIYNYGSGSIEITGGIVQGETYGIYNSNGGIIKITDGMVKGEKNTGTTYGICIRNKGKLFISGGTVSATNTSNSTTVTAYGVYCIGYSDVEITGGTIKSYCLNSNCYGVTNSERYNNSERRNNKSFWRRFL